MKLPHQEAGWQREERLAAFRFQPQLMPSHRQKRAVSGMNRREYLASVIAREQRQVTTAGPAPAGL
jgi:hypothetical protein